MNRFLAVIAALVLTACSAENPLVPPPPTATPAPPPVVVVQPTATPVPPAPTATPAPRATPAPTATPRPASPTPAPAFTGRCRIINDYGLDGKPELATSGSFIHAEYWWSGQPERETVLPAKDVRGGRFLLNRGDLRGHVWEYSPTCSIEQVMEQINAHIQRRLAGGANNGGFVDWSQTGLFRAQ